MENKIPFFKLNKYSKNVYSQYGEDGIINYLISSSKKKIYKNSIEFGGHDGKTNSNTYNLFENFNFKSIFIEGDKDRFELLNKLNSENLKTINKFVEISGENTLDKIIDDINFISKNEIGVLSIDIDSFDYHIFKNLNFNPQIIVIEYNNSIPGYINYSDPPGETYLRCSAKAIQELGFQKGYITVACTVTNVILIRKDCFNLEKHPNLPVEYLLDYQGMSNCNNSLYTLIHSQSHTTFPLFTKPPNFIDRIYFRITRFFYSTFGFRKEKFIWPSNTIKKKLIESNILW